MPAIRPDSASAATANGWCECKNSRSQGSRLAQHAQVHLLKGLDENCAWLGKHWPNSRYLMISLTFDAQGEEKPLRWVEGWRCAYDMKTGQFSIPPDFADHNAKAVEFPDQSRQ